MSTKTQSAYANQPVTLYTQANAGFACDDYDFLGWSKSATATAATYLGGETTTFNSDMSLYAVWKQKGITPEPVDITHISTWNISLPEYFRYGQDAEFTITNSSGSTVYPSEYVKTVIYENTLSADKYICQLSATGKYHGVKTITADKLYRVCDGYIFACVDDVLVDIDTIGKLVDYNGENDNIVNRPTLISGKSRTYKIDGDLSTVPAKTLFFGGVDLADVYSETTCVGNILRSNAVRCGHVVTTQDRLFSTMLSVDDISKYISGTNYISQFSVDDLGITIDSTTKMMTDGNSILRQVSNGWNGVEFILNTRIKGPLQISERPTEEGNDNSVKNNVVFIYALKTTADDEGGDDTSNTLTLRLGVIVDGNAVGKHSDYITINDREFGSDGSTIGIGAVKWNTINSSATTKEFDVTSKSLADFWALTAQSLGTFTFNGASDISIIDQPIKLKNTTKYQIDGMYCGQIGSGNSNATNKTISETLKYKAFGSSGDQYATLNDIVSKKTCSTDDTYSIIVIISSK